MGELPAGRGDKGWLSGEGMAFDSQRALLTAVHSSLGQLWACRGREWEGRKVGLRRSGAAGKSPWVQATWKLHRFGPKQTVMGQDPARSPSFWWLRSGPHPHPQGVTKVRGGGAAGAQMGGPPLALCDRVSQGSRARSPEASPTGDAGAVEGAACTHLASFLSWRAFFARVPLSGKKRQGQWPP